MTVDPISDEATGLPPLEELNNDETVVLLAWSTGDGIVAPTVDGHIGKTLPVRYLHVRGLIVDEGGVATWAQAHIAIPVEVLAEVAADLGRHG